MAILVTGSTGTIGSRVVAGLVSGGADVHALARTPEKTNLPGAKVVKGDLMDVDAMRAALRSATTLFLLNAVTPDEVTQALIALNLAREAGVERIVYLSVMGSDRYTNVPHFTGKHTVERMIEQFDLPATILRPNYFMQNDLALKDVIGGHGVYPMPVGSIGLSMVDVDDIAQVAVKELLRRERSAERLPREIINIVGPDVLTGASTAAIWSEVLGRAIAYGGDDTDAYEQQLRSFAPAWMAYDLRLMLDRFQRDGLAATDTDIKKITDVLGKAPRSYRDFAIKAAALWAIA